MMSIDGHARLFGDVVREHWGMENSVHWVLDVRFGEDQRRIWKDNSPEDLSMLRKMALNCMKQESAKAGMKRKRTMAGWDNSFLIKVPTGKWVRLPCLPHAAQLTLSGNDD
ncbi:MAG: hypothetical protein V3571_15375 [Pseudodesulfovibrio sp.]